MRVLCIMSHDVPIADTGRFKRYEAGRVYEVEDPEPGLFRAAGGTSDHKPEAAAKAPRHKEKKKTF